MNNGPCTVAAHQVSQFPAEGGVHEGVNDGVGHVVGEVAIEHHRVKSHHVVRHQPGGQEGQHEHQRDDKEHHGGADVGQQVLLLQAAIWLQHGLAALAVQLRHFEAVVQVVGVDLRICDGDIAQQTEVGVLPRAVPPAAVQQDRAVDDDVEQEDDDEADEEHGGVDFLVGFAEEGGEDELVCMAHTRVSCHLFVAGARGDVEVEQVVQQRLRRLA